MRAQATTSTHGELAPRSYREGLERLRRGELSDIAFKAFQAIMGVYEQRQAGRYMVRVRLSAGCVTPAQMAGVAWLSSQFGNGDVHVTTRQPRHQLARTTLPAAVSTTSTATTSCSC
jgi:sulfite reductase beta subunit-like hemoprotein